MFDFHVRDDLIKEFALLLHVGRMMVGVNVLVYVGVMVGAAGWRDDGFREGCVLGC